MTIARHTVSGTRHDKLVPLRPVVFAISLVLAACSDDRSLDRRIAKVAGPPRACAELVTLLDHLAQCVKVEDFRYPDIAITKSTLESNLGFGWTSDIAYCRKLDARFRDEFAECVRAEHPQAGEGSATTTTTGDNVPFDATVLGDKPHPFGVVSFVRANMTRDEIVARLPTADHSRRDIAVPLGIEGVTARVEIDFAGTLDVVRYRVPRDTRDRLVSAWGPPAYGNTWYDAKARWRADLVTFEELMVGPYVPFIELIGPGPDGLAEKTTLLGLTRRELEQRFGPRFNGSEILMPATNVCAYYTKLFVDFTNDRVAKLRFEQCFDDGTRAEAIIAAMTKQWGDPEKTADGLVFTLPGRTLTLAASARLRVTISAPAEHPAD